MLSPPRQLYDTQVTLLLIDSSNRYSTRLRSLLSPETQLSLSCRAVDDIPNLSLQSIDIVLVIIPSDQSDALDALQHVIQRLPDHPIIGIAPSINALFGTTLINAGASDYISLNAINAESLQRAFRYTLESHQRQAEIHQLRHQDTLTSLGSRCFFYQTALSLLNKVKAGDSQLALFTIDLDGFRKFNTQHGHNAGDEVVLQMAQRLMRAACDNDILARLGGDEFALLLECHAEENIYSLIKQRVDNILKVANSPYLLPEKSAILPCSIGVAHCKSGPYELDDLMRHASVARLLAKRDRHCSYRIYDSSLDEQHSIESELEPELAHALRAEQFELFFQPQVDLKTGKIVGAEALVRWLHPERGLIMPGEFITLCERNGMIIPIGYWAIHRAGVRLKELHMAGYDFCRLSVNLSFRQFQDSELAHTIYRIIHQNQINSAYLEFELTESALINDEQHVTHCLNELAGLGIDFSLDDFGTGYSSFALLQKLPISTLKIDRSFIRNVTESASDAEIVRAIINLAHGLDKKVIAEGVETQAQLDFLIEQGCDLVQGYFYSPPVPFKDFIQMLEQA